MPISAALHRKFLLAFIVSILLCGLVGIYVLLFGSFGQLEAQVLGTTASIGGASILAMAAAIAWERRRWQPIGPLAILAVTLALLFTIGLIWELPELWRQGSAPYNYNRLYYERLTTSAAVVAIALPHVALLSLARLRRQYEWVRFATIAAIGLLAVFILMLLWDAFGGLGEDFVIRLIGTLAILDACGTLAVPVLHRVSTIRRQEDIRTVELKLPITCPRCRKAQELPVGRSRCTCGLRFAIEIEEEHCATCGYALYNLTGDCCPECGTPIGAERGTAARTSGS